MKSITCASLALLATLAACGAKKPAEEPENATGDTATAEPAASTEALGAPQDVSPLPAAGGKAVGSDEGTKVPSPCNGFEIPDLLSVISQAACEAPDVKPDTKQKDVKDLLDVKVSLDAALVTPGSAAQVTVTYKNKGKVDLPLYFIVDPEPRFTFEAYTLKGDRADNPGGPAPALPPEVANAPAPDQKVAKVTLASQGTAKLVLKWDAVKYKWASKDRAKGALPGRGYPRDPAGPLKKGKYLLRVITPLTNISEGIDHEVSQPRTQVTVGGR